jgi:hypothetical protein
VRGQRSRQGRVDHPGEQHIALVLSITNSLTLRAFMIIFINANCSTLRTCNLVRSLFASLARSSLALSVQSLPYFSLAQRVHANDNHLYPLTLDSPHWDTSEVISSFNSLFLSLCLVAKGVHAAVEQRPCRGRSGPVPTCWASLGRRRVHLDQVDRVPVGRATAA